MSVSYKTILEQVREQLPEELAFTIDESASSQNLFFVPASEALDVIENILLVQPIPTQPLAPASLSDLAATSLPAIISGNGNGSTKPSTGPSPTGIYEGILNGDYVEAVIDLALKRRRLDPTRLSGMSRILASIRPLASEYGSTLPTKTLAKRLSKVCGAPVTRMGAWRYLMAFVKAGLVRPIEGKVFASKQRDREDCPFFVAEEPLRSAILLHAPEELKPVLPSVISDGKWDVSLFAGAHYFFPNFDEYLAWVLDQPGIFVTKVKRPDGTSKTTDRPLKAARAWTRVEQSKSGLEEADRKPKERNLLKLIRNKRGESA